MTPALCRKIIETCTSKITAKGAHVGLSFDAFFHNRNDDPELLIEAAVWENKTNRLDHFEKAAKVKKLVEDLQQ